MRLSESAYIGTELTVFHICYHVHMGSYLGFTCVWMYEYTYVCEGMIHHTGICASDLQSGTCAVCVCVHACTEGRTGNPCTPARAHLPPFRRPPGERWGAGCNSSIHLPLPWCRPQFSCAAPTQSSCPEPMPEVWVCNSDGYVGQVCLLSLRAEPDVEACIAVCSARILCIGAVPGLQRHGHR